MNDLDVVVFCNTNIVIIGLLIWEFSMRVLTSWLSKWYQLSNEIAQVHPEGKYVVDIDKSIDITKITPSTRVALRNDSYMLHLILPSKVDPLVNLMKVEKVPDSTYDMIGGLDQQIKEIKEVCFELKITIIKICTFWFVNSTFRSLSFQSNIRNCLRALELRNQRFVFFFEDHLNLLNFTCRWKRRILFVFQGVLLYGPPGTGKTLLARAVAHHTDCTFIRVSGSELVQKYIGEGSRMVRELFVMAR